MEMLRITSLLRSSEKTIEQQLEVNESLEKTRDYHMRTLADNAETVSVTADHAIISPSLSHQRLQLLSKLPVSQR